MRRAGGLMLLSLLARAGEPAMAQDEVESSGSHWVRHGDVRVEEYLGRAAMRFRTGSMRLLGEPFELIELLARIKALLRRSSHKPKLETFRFDDVEINFVSADVVRNGKNKTCPGELGAILRNGAGSSLFSVSTQKKFCSFSGRDDSTNSRAREVFRSSKPSPALVKPDDSRPCGSATISPNI